MAGALQKIVDAAQERHWLIVRSPTDVQQVTPGLHDHIVPHSPVRRHTTGISNVPLSSLLEQRPDLFVQLPSSEISKRELSVNVRLMRSAYQRFDEPTRPSVRNSERFSIGVLGPRPNHSDLEGEIEHLSRELKRRSHRDILSGLMQRARREHDIYVGGIAGVSPLQIITLGLKTIRRLRKKDTEAANISAAHIETVINTMIDGTMRAHAILGGGTALLSIGKASDDAHVLFGVPKRSELDTEYLQSVGTPSFGFLDQRPVSAGYQFEIKSRTPFGMVGKNVQGTLVQPASQSIEPIDKIGPVLEQPYHDIFYSKFPTEPLQEIGGASVEHVTIDGIKKKSIGPLESAAALVVVQGKVELVSKGDATLFPGSAALLLPGTEHVLSTSSINWSATQYFTTHALLIHNVTRPVAI